MGMTIIDYVIINEKGLDKIRKFKVEKKTKSDHQLLWLYFIRKKEVRQRKTEKVKSIISWSEEKVDKFITKEKEYREADLGNSWKLLKKGVKEEMTVETIRIRKNV